jgi:hypothetical protein
MTDQPGEICNVFPAPNENAAASQSHSADLYGERSQLRAGLGTTVLTTALRSSDGFTSETSPP